MTGPGERGVAAVPAERGDPELAAAVSEYLRMTHGNVEQALAVAVADGLAVSRLVSTGFARLRQPAVPRKAGFGLPRLPRRHG